ncbi:MAG: protein kinase [Lachnospiraceae bacterium]|nr:protein kinase [Lachnospiraceae bacterium]
METTLQETYELLRPIGEGGMSSVYLARHRRLGTMWAVKTVSKTQGVEFNFTAEADILKKLKHPMLPTIIDIFDEPDMMYLVEEFVEGVTLESYLKKNGRVPEEQLIAWFKDLCDVFGYLHGRKPHPIIYRDMKPANVMVQPDGSLKLIDFGIAREYKAGAASDTQYIGTQGYAAPEQYGTSQTDERTDIYSLGVTMYHLITGKSPYDPPYDFVPVRQLVKSLSPGIEYILNHCIQKEPENRYPNVGAILHDLENIYIFDKAWKKTQRKKLMRGLTLGVCFSLSAALLAAGVYIRQDELYVERVEKAYQLYQQQNYEECIAYTTNSLQKYPEDADLALVLASAYYSVEDYEGAAAYYYRAAEIKDMDESSLRDFAVSLGRMGAIDEASRVMEQLVALGGAQDNTYYVQGEILMSQGKYVEAAAAFESAIAATEQSDMIRKAYMSLAMTYRDSAKLPAGDPQRIADVYTGMISVISRGLAQQELQNNTVLLEMLGAAYYNRAVSESNAEEDYRQAGNTFMQVIRLGVQSDYLYVNACNAYQLIGAYDEAGQVLDQMKSIYSASYVPHALRSILYVRIENAKPEAERDYSAAYEEYQVAAGLVTAEDDRTQFQQLETIIEQLRAGNWLND